MAGGQILAFPIDIDRRPCVISFILLRCCILSVLAKTGPVQFPELFV